MNSSTPANLNSQPVSSTLKNLAELSSSTYSLEIFLLRQFGKEIRETVEILQDDNVQGCEDLDTDKIQKLVVEFLVRQIVGIVDELDFKCLTDSEFNEDLATLVSDSNVIPPQSIYNTASILGAHYL